jgi:hypothetical protein
MLIFTFMVLQVVQRLRGSESLQFVSELRLVASSIDVRALLLSFPGGVALYQHEAQAFKTIANRTNCTNTLGHTVSSSYFDFNTTSTTNTTNRGAEEGQWVDAKEVLHGNSGIAASSTIRPITASGRLGTISIIDDVDPSSSTIIPTTTSSNSTTSKPLLQTKASGLMLLPRIRTTADEATRSRLVHTRASFVSISGATSTSISTSVNTSIKVRSNSASSTSSSTSNSTSSSAKRQRSASASSSSSTASNEVQEAVEDAVRAWSTTSTAFSSEEVLRGSGGSVKKLRSVSFADDFDDLPNGSSVVVDGFNNTTTSTNMLDPFNMTTSSSTSILEEPMFFPEDDYNVPTTASSNEVLFKQVLDKSKTKSRPTNVFTSSLPNLSGVAGSTSIKKPRSRITDKVFTEIFEDVAANKPLALLSRKDERKVVQDETLLLSNKVYLRQPVEVKLSKVLARQKY